MNSLDTNKHLKTLIGIGIYQSEDEVIQDALQHLLQAHPEYKLKVAIDKRRNWLFLLMIWMQEKMLYNLM